MNKTMRLVLAAGFLSSPLAMAANFKIDTSHSEVGFAVKHLVISNVKGRFNKFEGMFDYDEKTKTVSKVDVKIDVKSIDTNDKKRDEHLSSPDFFDAEKFASLEFKADKISGVEPKKTVMVPGTLTIRGVSKPVTLDVQFLGTTTDPMGNFKVAFSASTKIKRADYGITWNKTLDKGGLAVGEEVAINIEAEANKDK